MHGSPGKPFPWLTLPQIWMELSLQGLWHSKPCKILRHARPYCGWTKSASHHFETMGHRISSIHSTVMKLLSHVSDIIAFDTRMRRARSLSLMRLHEKLAGREIQGKRNGTTPRKTIRLVTSFKGKLGLLQPHSLPIAPARKRQPTGQKKPRLERRKHSSRGSKAPPFLRGTSWGLPMTARLSKCFSCFLLPC